MNIRIRTGIAVQSTSTGVLWLHRAGVGLARLLKRTMHDQQQRQHQQRDRGDDRHQDPVVELDRLVLEDRGGRLQVDRAGGRLTHQISGLRRACAAPQRRKRRAPRTPHS